METDLCMQLHNEPWKHLFFIYCRSEGHWHNKSHLDLHTLALGSRKVSACALQSRAFLTSASSAAAPPSTTQIKKGK